MPIQRPRHFWHPPDTDAGTDDLRATRDRAADRVYALRRERVIVAVSGSGSSHKYRAQAKNLGQTLAQLGFTLTTGGLDGVMIDVTDGLVQVASSPPGFFGESGKIVGRAIGIVPKGRGCRAEELRKSLPGEKLIDTDLAGKDSHGAKHEGPTAEAACSLPRLTRLSACLEEGSIDEAMLAKIYRFTTVWAMRSETVGIPSGRVRPSPFGMSTRRTAGGK
jgi:SLOG cluster4 family